MNGSQKNETMNLKRADNIYMNKKLSFEIYPLPFPQLRAFLVQCLGQNMWRSLVQWLEPRTLKQRSVSVMGSILNGVFGY